jgi:signal transduction histidine kinase
MTPPFAVRSHGSGSGSVPLAAAEAIYSAAVQAMVNSLQHAGPKARRWVEVGYPDAGGLEIRIGDDGAGFDPGAVPTERLGVRVSILERVTSAGGRAEIDTAPGRGTVVTLAWPGEGEAAP